MCFSSVKKHIFGKKSPFVKKLEPSSVVCLCTVPLHICNIQAANDSARHRHNKEKEKYSNFWIDNFRRKMILLEKIVFVQFGLKMLDSNKEIVGLN